MNSGMSLTPFYILRRATSQQCLRGFDENLIAMWWWPYEAERIKLWVFYSIFQLVPKVCGARIIPLERLLTAFDEMLPSTLLLDSWEETGGSNTRAHPGAMRSSLVESFFDEMSLDQMSLEFGKTSIALLTIRAAERLLVWHVEGREAKCHLVQR